MRGPSPRAATRNRCGIEGISNWRGSNGFAPYPIALFAGPDDDGGGDVGQDDTGHADFGEAGLEFVAEF